MLQSQGITIIGTGLLGASIGLALRQAGFAGRIIGLGRRQSTLDDALRTGAIDLGTSDYAEAVGASDLVIVAVPLSGFRAVFEQIAPHDRPELVVTDVGSTKVSVHADARAALPDVSRFVGSHPMAGSEQKGPTAARADLLAGKPCIITADDDADPAAVKRVEALWQAVGMKLVRMTAKQHDEQTAAISHLPHAAAALLVQVADELGGWDIASTGFKDTTRLASSNPPMRADILSANRDAVLAALDVYQAHIAGLREALAAGDHERLLGILERSRELRERWLEARKASS